MIRMIRTTRKNTKNNDTNDTNDMNDNHLLNLLNEISDTELKAHLCKLSLFEFVKEFWKEAGIHEVPQWNWHIPFLCKYLEKKIIRVSKGEPNDFDLDINIPPGTTKTLLVTIFAPAWAWAKWPWMKFIKLSYSAVLSLEHAETCRELVRSEKYQTLFPNVRIKRDKDTKSNFRIQYYDAQNQVWKLGGALFSTSIQGTVTGMHSHIILIDDPLDPYKALSLKELTSTNTWIQNVLPTRKINKEVTPIIQIMQRTNVDDPSGQNEKLMEKGVNIKKIILPGTVERKEVRERVSPKSVLKFYDKNNGLLDPVRLPLKVLRDLEIKLGSYGYAAQIEQVPKEPGGVLFDIDNFNNYLPDDFNWTNNLIKEVRYWDKAGTTDGGAFTAGIRMALIASNDGIPRYVIRDVVRGQWGAEARETVIESVAIEDGPSVIGYVEQEPGSGGKESAENTINRLAKHGLTYHADRPSGDKFVRADPYSVAFKRNQICLVKAPWNKPFLDEHRHFSPTASYKDQVDASSGAYIKINTGYRAGGW